MSKVKIQGDAGGTGIFTVAAPATNTDRTITLPDSTGTLLTSSSSINAANVTTGTLPKARLPSGAVLQVISTDYTSLFSTSSTTPVDVTGFSATITPTSSTSKILVMVSVAFGGANDIYPYVLLKRNGTSLSTGVSASGNQINVFLGGYFTAIASMTYAIQQFSKNYLDSPSTTSALTYQIQLANPYTLSPNAFINRQENQSNNSYVQYPTSSITLMEIAA